MHTCMQKGHRKAKVSVNGELVGMSGCGSTKEENIRKESLLKGLILIYQRWKAIHTYEN